MSNQEDEPFLRVIEGTGRSTRPARPLLAFVLDTSCHDGQQLALPGVIPTCTVISVSPAALFNLDLVEIFRGVRARHIVDMRLAVEFGSLGLSRREFNAIVQHLGLDYRHSEELANRNHELSWNPNAMWDRFREQLRHDPAHTTLLWLRDMVDDGPVVLLSESPYHSGSERLHVMDALQEIRPGFACHHIDPGH